MKTGKLTVVVGSMFSGKSSELQRQGRRKEIAGQLVFYFKPSKDTRYTAEVIETHDGHTVTAYVVQKPEDILEIITEVEQHVGDVGTVCIDEVQFFDSVIVPVIENLLRTGVDVVCAGLDLDRFGEPFGSVPELLCKAETVLKVQAVCNNCGLDAYVSSGRFKSDSQTVIGERDLYEPLCRKCFYERGNLL